MDFWLHPTPAVGSISLSRNLMPITYSQFLALFTFQKIQSREVTRMCHVESTKRADVPWSRTFFLLILHLFWEIRVPVTLELQAVQTLEVLMFFNLQRRSGVYHRFRSNQSVCVRSYIKYITFISHSHFHKRQYFKNLPVKIIYRNDSILPPSFNKRPLSNKRVFVNKHTYNIRVRVSINRGSSSFNCSQTKGNATLKNKDPLSTGSPNRTLKIPHQKAFIYGVDVNDTVTAIGVEID